MLRALSLLALLALAGCGSESVDQLPPAAGPPRSPPAVRPAAGTVLPIGRAHVGRPAHVTTLGGGRIVVVLMPRERRLELRSAETRRRLGSTPVGVGPTHAACLDTGPCFVADTRGDALLIVKLQPLRVARRVYLPGGPYGLALDPVRRRLWVTLPGRNLVAELPAHGRPHVLAELPTVRQPDSIAVDPRTGVVAITGRAAGVLQLLRPRAAAPR